MSEKMPTFLRNPDIYLKEMGDEAILYDDGMKALHVLNRTARLIWEHCDGYHSIPDIERILRTHFSIDNSVDLETDIRQTLDTLLSKGLVREDFEG
jgi:hypothetical protein